MSCFFCLIIILISIFAEALDPSKTVSQYLLDSWTTSNGLPQNSVQAIVQTYDGYLWLGTQEGLVRFEDHQGNLWIGTSGGGLIRYSNGNFVTFTKHDGLSDSSVRFLYENRNGTLWIGPDLGGLKKFRNGKFTVYRNC